MHLPPVYTVESVTSGHPDKVCDQISDAILDACLAQDPYSRVAVETFGAHGQLMIGGEVTTTADVDYAAIARHVYHHIGYGDGIDINVHVSSQSPDIARGVDAGGAGDQGIMYGFATDETPEGLPAGVVLVHRLTKGLENLRRHDQRFSFLGPDGKAQVSIERRGVSAVVVSAQHNQGVTLEELRRALSDHLVEPVIDSLDGVGAHINPAGAWHRGGFAADTGLTGRKIMVDTYGGIIPHGGGAFSGKDATKVDRSGAYMARFVAKQIVAKGLARQCLVSVAYAIGKAEPVMVAATDENGRDISAHARQFDFRPQAIIERLGLRQPIFQQTAAYGHFGKPGLPWEQ